MVVDSTIQYLYFLALYHDQVQILKIFYVFFTNVIIRWSYDPLLKLEKSLNQPLIVEAVSEGSSKIMCTIKIKYGSIIDDSEEDEANDLRDNVENYRIVGGKQWIGLPVFF